jgi:hypothetical protein
MPSPSTGVLAFLQPIIFGAIKASEYSKMEYALVNYFWLITIAAVFWHVIGIGWIAGLLFPIIIYWCLFFEKSRKANSSIIDMFWWFIFLWNIITILSNSYPYSEVMAVRCMTSQIAYMLMYWIVRKNPKISISAIITSGYVPFVLVCIIGIIFYIYPPSWYLNVNDVAVVNQATTFAELETLRLRSIFASSYDIAYFGVILLIFEFFVLIKGTRKKNIHYCIIAITIITVILTTMRAPIASMVVGFCIALIYANKYGGFKNIKTFSIILGIAAIAIIVVISNVDSFVVEYLFGKYDSVTNSDSNFIQERLLRNKGNLIFTLLGEGVGRHNMYADMYPPNSLMRDGEYVKLLVEQGYIGAFLNILFWGSAIIKSVFNFKNLTFEFCLLVMLGICMIGANPLSTVDKYPFIYWMAAGQIANFKLYGKNKIINLNSDI